MPRYDIRSEPLGVALTFESDEDLDDRAIYEVLGQVVTPQDMLKAYKAGHEDLAIEALRNGFFDEEGAGFMAAAGKVLGDLAEGVGETFTTSAFQTERLRLAQSEYGKPVEKPRKVFSTLEMEGVTEAAKQLLGLSRKFRPEDEFKFTQADAFVPAQKTLDADFGKHLSQAMQFAGLDEMDNILKRQVIGEANRLNRSQAAATRGKGAAEAMGGISLMAAKGKQFGREAGDVLTGGGEGPWGEGVTTIGGDPRIYLDYLTEEYPIMEAMERGAALAAEQGGALALMAKSMNIPHPWDPDMETYNDIISKRVVADPEAALAGSMVMSPDVWATGGLSAGVMAPFRFIARGAIMKAGQGAARASARAAAFRSSVAELEALQTLGKRHGDISLGVGATKLTPKQASWLKEARALAVAEGAELASHTQQLEKLSKRSAIAASQAAQQTADPAARAAIHAAGASPKAPLVNKVVGQTLRAAGIPTEYVGRLAEYLRRFPEEQLISYFQRTGMDEAAAKSSANLLTNTSVAAGGLAYVTDMGQEFPGLGESLAFLLLTKGGSNFVARLGKDMGLLGKQLTKAQVGVPYFAAIGALPDVDPSFTGVTLDRTAALTFSETAGDLGRILSPSRDLGPSVPLRATSTFLAQTGLGETVAAPGRFAREVASAAALPAAIGYAIGGPEGAGAAVGLSLPFVAAGTGFGALMRYRSKADITARNLGNLAHYKDTYLASHEVDAFNKLSKPTQQAVATYQIQHPDVFFEIKPGKGSSHWNREGDVSKITIFEGDSKPMATIMAHEVAHHIDFHGFAPEIIELTLGSVDKGKPGIFTKFEDGKPVERTGVDGRKSYAYNKEFIRYRNEYLRQLDLDPNVSDRHKKRYQSEPELIAQEIFAEHVAEDILSGGFVRQAYRGAGSKLMRAFGKKLTGNTAVKRFAHKIGLATDADGKIFGSGLFREVGGVRKIPELSALVERYNAETLGVSKKGREAGKGRGRLVDQKEFPDEFADVVLTAKDVAAPEVVQKLKAGGHVKTDDAGELVVDSLGRPIFLPVREVNKTNRQLANDVKDALRRKEETGEAFPEGHMTLEKTADGGERATGRFLDDHIIDELAASGRYSAAQIQMLRKINTSLRDMDGGQFSLFYYAALKWNRSGRKVYGSIKGGERTSVPFGLQISKAGNLLIDTISLDAFEKNLKWWTKNRPEEMAQAFEAANATAAERAALALLPKYLQNHLNGIKNGVDPESGVTIAQRDILNAAIGKINERQVALNPRLEGLGPKLSNRLHSYRSRRLDRIGDAYKVGDGMPVSTTSIAENLRPDRVFMPAESKGRPEKILLRTTPAVKARAKAVAAERGISMNDALNVALEEALPGRETPVPERAEGDITLKLTPEEEALLAKPEIGEREADAYREAVSKRRRIAHRDLRARPPEDRLFMPREDELPPLPSGEPAGPRYDPKLWITRNAKVFGPFSRDAVEGYLQSNRISPDDLAWVDGMEDWGPVDKVLGEPSYPPPEMRAPKDPRQAFEERGFQSPLAQKWLTKNGTQVPELAKKIGRKFEPTVFYHGGEVGLHQSRGSSEYASEGRFEGEYRPREDPEGRWTFEPGRPVWLARDEYFAREYSPRGRDPVRLITRATKIFDPSDPAHAKLLEGKLSLNEQALSVKHVQSGFDTLQALGFDGMWESQFRGDTDTKRLKRRIKRLREDPDFFRDETQLIVFDGSDLKLAADHEIPVSGEFTESGRLFMPAGDRPLGLSDNIRDVVLPGIKQDKFSRGQLEAALRKTAGARAYADEIGLIDWLEDRKSATKAEVDAFVKENAPRLEEEVLGRPNALPEGWKVQRVPESDLWHVVDEGGEQIGFATETAEGAAIDVLQSNYLRGVHPELGESKFSEYQEPGGTNYREVVIKLPVEEGKAVFPDPLHFGDNVLLWFRLNDRINVDGKKVMFIEEVQSQWHQKGRKKGYNKPVNESVNPRVRWPELRALQREAQSILEKRQALEAEGRIGESNALANEHNAINARIRSVKGKGVPDAPFKKNWPALALKRAIKEALEGGYDEIAWLGGEAQAARYDLSKHLSEVRFDIREGDKGGHFKAFDHDGKMVIKETGVTLEKLSDLVGKDVAEKLMADKPDLMGVRRLTDLDLKVGGEGMKAFYDRELVSIANKISKKIGGGKVGRSVLLRTAYPKNPPGGQYEHAYYTGFKLPKNPQAVENLTLYMPAEKTPSDGRPPELIYEIDKKGQTMLPFEKGFPRKEEEATHYSKLVDEQRAEAGEPPLAEAPPPRDDWRAGNVRSKDAYGRDKLFMPAAPEDASPNTVSSWGDGDSPSFPAGYRRGQAGSNEDVGKLFQEKYVEKYGEPIDPYDYGPEAIEWLADMIAGEGEAALKRRGNAVDWYTTAVERAMTIAEEIFPEIKTSAEAKDRFLGALAITSQNMRVFENAKAAVYQYEHKAKHGKFDYEINHGEKAPAITKNLRAFDLLEAKLGDKLPGFFDKDFTVRELTQFGKKFFGDKKFTIEGRMDDAVKGSAVFGPKIGQGFFQNLKGNYDPVTIDLWLRRTFGRLTGRSVDVSLSPQAIGRLIYSHRKNTGRHKTDFDLPDFLRGLKISGSIAKDGKMHFKISDRAFERLFGEHEQGAANTDAVFQLAGRLSKEWERRFAAVGRSVAKAKSELQARVSPQKGFRTGKPTKRLAARLAKAEAEKSKLQAEKPFWAYAATSISGKLKPIDIPTPQERAVIVEAFGRALEILREKGYDLTPADLQATLWYPEKDIWAFLKGDKADALNISYDQAMEKIRDAR